MVPELSKSELNFTRAQDDFVDLMIARLMGKSKIQEGVIRGLVPLVDEVHRLKCELVNVWYSIRIAADRAANYRCKCDSLASEMLGGNASTTPLAVGIRLSCMMKKP